MKKIDFILLMLLIMTLFAGCATHNPPPIPEPPDPCKYKTVPDYDQSCLDSIPGEWELDPGSQAMVNKKYKKFCWPTGTKEVPYDCEESKFDQGKVSGRWKITGSSKTAQCYPFTATADIDPYGHGKFSGTGFSHDMYIDPYGNVKSYSWKRFKGKCTTNDYCSGTYKYTRSFGACIGAWEGSKTY